MPNAAKLVRMAASRPSPMRPWTQPYIEQVPEPVQTKVSAPSSAPLPPRKPHGLYDELMKSHDRMRSRRV